MSSCLCIDEIVQNVVGFVQDREALSTLALVSRAFLEPANDALWSDLPSLKPLVACLFNGYEDTHGYPGALGNSTSSRDVVPEANWRRFQHRASRVKSLVVPHESWKQGCNVKEEELAFLARHHPDPILPRLQHLQWYNWDLFKFAPLFVHDTLRTLDCDPLDGDELCPILERVRTTAPRIQKLVMFSNNIWGVVNDTHEVLSDITTTISALSYLTEFTFTHITLPTETLLHLSRLPEFTILALTITELNVEAWRSRSWGGFPALQHLTLTCGNFASIAPISNFLHALCKFSLVHLSLHHDRRVLADAIEFHQLISAVMYFPHLTLLVIRFPESASQSPDSIVDGIALRPLYNVPGIKDITLCNAPVIFTPQALVSMVHAWPELQQVDITPPSDAPQCQFRIESLAILSRGCRALRTVKVHLQTVDADWDYEGEISWPISIVTHLHLHRSRISPQAEAAVTTYLAAIFPLAEITHLFARCDPRPRWDALPQEDYEAADLLERISTSKRKLAFDIFRQALAAKRLRCSTGARGATTPSKC